MTDRIPPPATSFLPPPHNSSSSPSPGGELYSNSNPRPTASYLLT